MTTDNLKSTITENIKYFRTKMGVSQEKLSDMCGYSSTYIGKIERGQRSPSLDTLIRIAESLQVPINSFFDPFYSRQDELKSDWNPSDFTPYDSTLRRFNYLVGELSVSGEILDLRHLPWFHAEDIEQDAVGTNVTNNSFLNFSSPTREALEEALGDAKNGKRTHLSLKVSGNDFRDQATDFVLLPESKSPDDIETLQFELFYPRIVRNGQKVPLDELHFDLI